MDQDGLPSPIIRSATTVHSRTLNRNIIYYTNIYHLGFPYSMVLLFQSKQYVNKLFICHNIVMKFAIQVGTTKKRSSTEKIIRRDRQQFRTI